MESVAYDETISKKQRDAMITFITAYLLWYKLYRSPSSAFLAIPPPDELDKMIKKIDKYCKEHHIEKNTVEYESALASDTFQEWRNYLFYVYIPGGEYEYRIDPLQNGDENAYPNNIKSISGVKFRRANLNSYVWFLLYDNDDKKFYLYPTSDCKKSERIGLNFIAVVKHGKYIFQAESAIPNNAANKVKLNNKTANQLMDVFIGAGIEKKYPISNLVEKWKSHGLELGSQLALCEMYKTNKSQVLKNMSANLTHSAILSALDNITPSDINDDEEAKKLVNEMKSQYKTEQYNMKGGNFKLDKHSSVKSLYDSIKKQYPSNTRSNIIKADVMCALINKGMEPDLAFSALDYSTRRDDSKEIIEAVKASPYEYFNSKEHIPVFAINDDNEKQSIKDKDNIASISKIYESSSSKNASKNYSKHNEADESNESNEDKSKEETSKIIPTNRTEIDKSDESSSDSDDEIEGGDLDLSDSDSSEEDTNDVVVKQEEANDIKVNQEDDTKNDNTDNNENDVKGGSKKKCNKKCDKTCSKKAKVNFNKWF